MVIENPSLESTLEVFSLATRSRRVIHRAERHFEAPNWSRDGGTLLVNSDGLLYSIPVEGGVLDLVDTELAKRCNNDHGYSPCGLYIAISDETVGPSQIYVLPAVGGAPRLVTTLGPSYWHGWSPDGRTLVYCAGRSGQYDIYAINVDGGDETRLTQARGLDDGPDYSPCGQYIYFNSDRSGNMRIYRMRPDGSDQTQLTFNDEYGDWFAHPSPDGKYLVFISYDSSVKGHPPNKPVVIRLMTLPNGPIEVLCQVFGGQGTLNVPSWSPDSSEFAFVSYRLT
jgi:Tol biopolymer transport system component